MSLHATGAYWAPVISSGQSSCGYGRCGRWIFAASAAIGKGDNAAASRTATDSRERMALVSAFGANQLPVRIARGGIAGKCPNIGDIGYLFRIPVDDGAGGVAGHRHHLRHKADRQLRGAVARFGADKLRLVDRDESRLGLLSVLFAIL